MRRLLQFTEFDIIPFHTCIQDTRKEAVQRVRSTGSLDGLQTHIQIHTHTFLTCEFRETHIIVASAVAVKSGSPQSRPAPPSVPSARPCVWGEGWERQVGLVGVTEVRTWPERVGAKAVSRVQI